MNEIKNGIKQTTVEPKRERVAKLAPKPKTLSKFDAYTAMLKPDLVILAWERGIFQSKRQADEKRKNELVTLLVKDDKALEVAMMKEASASTKPATVKSVEEAMGREGDLAGMVHEANERRKREAAEAAAREEERLLRVAGKTLEVLESRGATVVRFSSHATTRGEEVAAQHRRRMNNKRKHKNKFRSRGALLPAY